MYLCITRPHCAPVHTVCDASISAQMPASNLLAHVPLIAHYHCICITGMPPCSFLGMTLLCFTKSELRQKLGLIWCGKMHGLLQHYL